MSDTSQFDRLGLAAGGASIADVVTQLKLGNQVASAIQQAILSVFPRISGTFTLAAAATTAVAQASTTSTSVIIPFPSNAAAATLMGSAKSLYISARSPGVSFTVATASGAAAAGTETFTYMLYTPS